MHKRVPLSRQAWETIFWRTLVITLVSVFVSVLVSDLLLSTFSGGLGLTGLAAAMMMPVLLGAPVFFHLSLTNQQLRMAYSELEAAAARDSLTHCLNHGAFVASTNEVLGSDRAEQGALLVIDADYFKSINDRYGHENGDQALKAIARTIRESVRTSDLVGRMGGEEFAVLLPGATATGASAIAESIRLNIRNLRFAPQGKPCPLTVSVGGVVFRSSPGFGQLFRIADRQLYAVKNSGRDMSALIEFDPDWDEDEAALAQAV